jgi:ribonuclease HII
MKSRKIIAGIDEVGRGSLIGSVYSAAVIFNNDSLITDLSDSKKINVKNRLYLANIIIDKAAAVSIGIATRDEIDDLNIHHATLLSMKRAIDNLTIKADLLLIDGKYAPETDIETHTIIKGDNLINQISAASIIAKVSRDNEMLFLNDKFTQYDFSKNKGYGTKHHLSALAQFGKTIYHRESFLK